MDDNKQETALASGTAAFVASPSSPSGLDQRLQSTSGECEHKFVYGGLRYSHGELSRPGSGATNTYYGHAYYCERCLAHRVEAISGDHNSYQQPLPSSTPATSAERELLVPKFDRSCWRRF